MPSIVLGVAKTPHGERAHGSFPLRGRSGGASGGSVASSGRLEALIVVHLVILLFMSLVSVFVLFSFL